MSFNLTLANLSAETTSFFPATSSPYLNAGIIFLASIILAWIADLLFKQVFTRIAAHTETDIDDKIIGSLMGPIFYAVLIIGIYASFHALPFTESHFIYIDNLIQTVFIIVASVGVSRVSLILIDSVGKKFAARTKSALDEEMLPLFKNIARIIIIFVALMLTLAAWDVNVTPLLASAGVLGIALAFAAQSTVANLFGGVAIYFDKPFKIGDRIQLETGEIGDVLEVGIRSSRVRTLDDTLIIIPNDKIANSKIINFHQPVPRMNVKINVGVAYGTNPAKVKKILLKIANDSPTALKDPKPQVLFLEHGDFALKFLLIVWVNEPSKKYVAIDEINEGIAREFAREKIDIPFPTQTVYMRK